MADTATSAPVAEGVWPNLTEPDQYAIWLVNIGAFLFAWILLRLIWPPPTPEQVSAQKEVEIKINDLKAHYYDSMSQTLRKSMQNLKPVKSAKDCLEGESAGDYSLPWTQTFDLWFCFLMLGFLLILCVWTFFTAPELFSDVNFWVSQLPKVATMMIVSLFGGLLCRYFCEVDANGYIVTSKTSIFKVNYTRKLQHFAAYLVPLVFHSASGHSGGPLLLAWGNWFTMLSFLILIKPLRERATFIMLQFNSLDRPEDRPNTLSWIVGGNILPGALLILFFRWAYSYTGQENMTYIFLFITGVGDGLAEPVGIYLGKHKYWVAGIGEDRRYQRSWEGSACVFLSSIVFVSIFYQTLASREQFWASLIVLPPLMAYSEAMSPHTIDTPFLMGMGGLALWLISHITLGWQ